MAKTHRYLWIFGSTLVALYIGSYGVLTMNGRFEPEAVGAGGIKWHAWYPAGFMKHEDDKRLKPAGITAPLFIAYYPLYWCDRKYWHNSKALYSEKYPVNQWKP